jgi:UDP-N-acetylglucosamine 1-carboxyvinyltransferase
MKNAATPIIAASLLSKRPVTIHRVPQIVDVDRMLDLIERLGCKVEKSGSTVVIDPRGVSAGNPDPLLMKRMRSSILLISPLLVLHDTVSFPTPGGCHIGNRPIDTHIDALRQLGVKTTEQADGSFLMNKEGKPLPTVILSEFSVTATENALVYASSLLETVKIKMAAAEPHVQDLCGFLKKGGVSITGVGTHELMVKGTKEFVVDEWEIIPDQIEIGTIAVAAAVTNGDVDIHPVIPDHLDAILMKMKEAGVAYTITADHLRVASSGP